MVKNEQNSKHSHLHGTQNHFHGKLESANLYVMVQNFFFMYKGIVTSKTNIYMHVYTHFDKFLTHLFLSNA